ncbi:Dit2 protein [Xylariaceae sp. FL1272]|nr:Dit2 protein [Xylariaceae sp. FL1272]
MHNAPFSSSMAFLWIAVTLLCGVVWAVVRFVTRIVLPPSHFPGNIPTIPFYYTLLALFKEVDQEQLYHQYLKQPLQQHGAVKIFFGGHWNVLITRPAYMAQVLKDDEDFPKAGNHVKNPDSVLALYTGENVISAIGDTWKHFAATMKPGLQSPVDASVIAKNAHALIDVLLQDKKRYGLRSVTMVDHIQAYAIANVSESLLGTQLDVLENRKNPLLQLQKEIKPKIFNPVHLNFPILDRFYMPSREKAKQLVKTFKSELTAIVKQGHSHRCQPDQTNLGCRLIAAWDAGQLSDYHLQQNLLITFVAGHENAMIMILSTLFVLAERPELQSQVRAEVFALPPGARMQPDALASLPLLMAVIFETLRVYPPLSQIMNKRTAKDVILGDDILLRAGTFTGYNGYSTNRNRDFWGVDADEFRPSRWGETVEDANALFRRATSKAEFITFHGGKRACLGQKWALATQRVTMAVFLTSLKWRLDPTWSRMMTPAGPLMPKNLRLELECLSVESGGRD